MKIRENRRQPRLVTLLFCLGAFIVNFSSSAQDAAKLVSQTVATNTQVNPRTYFTQTWTLQNTGTTTWSPGEYGYTLNMIGQDSLGAVPITANPITKRYEPAAAINSGASIPPGGQATFTFNFIAPETPGTYTDTFQLNSASSVFFGPTNTIQIVVPAIGSTNQYDRARVISYANNFDGYVASDGYFWTNSCGSCFTNFGAGAPVPTAYLGDDCAHFVSCCIGSEPHVRGGGLKIASRVPPTYGEPGAQRIIYTNLIAAGFAKEVSSFSEMLPGDVIGWNWEGSTDTADIDHVTLYLGNGLTASHAISALDVSASTYFQSSETNWVYHLIHIYDAPTLGSSTVGTNLVLSWGTNWTGYALYTSSSLSTNATWTKMSKSPVVVNGQNVMTNAMSSGHVFYRLILP
jgi:hypothetical protein